MYSNNMRLDYRICAHCRVLEMLFPAADKQDNWYKVIKPNGDEKWLCHYCGSKALQPKGATIY